MIVRFKKCHVVRWFFSLDSKTDNFIWFFILAQRL